MKSYQRHITWKRTWYIQSYMHMRYLCRPHWLHSHSGCLYSRLLSL